MLEPVFVKLAADLGSTRRLKMQRELSRQRRITKRLLENGAAC